MRTLEPEISKSRKRNVLQAIIYHYINTARPVSSKAITDEYDISL